MKKKKEGRRRNHLVPRVNLRPFSLNEPCGRGRPGSGLGPLLVYGRNALHVDPWNVGLAIVLGTRVSEPVHFLFMAVMHCTWIPGMWVWR